MNADLTVCPECGAETRPGVLVCPNCGVNMLDVRFGQTLLISDLEEYAARGAAIRARQDQIPGKRVILQAKDGESIQTDCDQPMVLGRINTQRPHRPDIDLTRFQAFQLGVSCRHARLHRMDDLLQLSDLGSTNGTYLNAERLIPHRAYALRDGDEIRLGRLFLTVRLGVETKAPDKA